MIMNLNLRSGLALLINRLLFVINMEKPCERCGIVTMTDDEHRICYDCFVELDIMDREEE